MSKLPSTKTVTYAAGRDWLNVEVGVTGERKDKMRVAGVEDESGAGIE